MRFKQPLYLIVWAIAALVIVIGCAKPKAGERCSGDKGCAEGADCLTLSTSSLPNLFGPEEGICFQRAKGGGVCPPGQENKELAGGSYCAKVAPIGKPCGAELMCKGDAECLYNQHETDPVPGRHPGTCRASCGFGTACPTGEACQKLAPNMPGISPDKDPMLYFSLLQSAPSYCMPIEPEADSSPTSAGTPTGAEGTPKPQP